MVEELIAEGLSPAEVVEFVMINLGMSESEAELYVNTALGGTGDVVIEDVDELVASVLPVVPSGSLHSEMSTPWEER